MGRSCSGATCHSGSDLAIAKQFHVAMFERNDQHHSSHETPDMCPVGDIIAAPCRGILDELKNKPNAQHDDSGDPPDEETEEDEDSRLRIEQQISAENAPNGATCADHWDV